MPLPNERTPEERRTAERKSIRQEDLLVALDPVQNILKNQRLAARTISILTGALIVLAILLGFSLNIQHDQAKTINQIQANQAKANCIREKLSAFLIQQGVFQYNFANVLSVEINERESLVEKLKADATKAQELGTAYSRAGKTCDKEQPK